MMQEKILEQLKTSHLKIENMKLAYNYLDHQFWAINLIKYYY